MDFIYVIIIIIIVSIAFVYFYKLLKDMIIENSRGVYINMRGQEKDLKRDLNKMKTVETDDKMVRLINASDTNMTELGMAIEKGNVNIHILDDKYPGMEVKLFNKFKTMTMDLIAQTKAIDLADPPIVPDQPNLNLDNNATTNFIKLFKMHWRYYSMIFDAMSICKDLSYDKNFEDCYKFYKDNYKDQPLEQLHESYYYDIEKYWDDALNYIDKRISSIQNIQKKLIELFP